jgi:hypothetical protein
MLITFEQIWNKLTDLEKKLDSFLNGAQEFSIEEVSLNKACKLLRLGNATIIRLVRSKKLEARTYRDSNHKLRYRFLLKDIKTFQESTKYHQTFLNENAESAEEIAKRIFNKPERKAV